MGELGQKAKRNRISNYMDTLPEEFEVLEDNLMDEDPNIKLQTKTRIISLSCNEKGNVLEDFRMRRGAGAKDDFLKKQEAYTAIKNYYDDFYTGAKIKENSFDEGFLKIELETKIITLTYDFSTKSVEEKDRIRRGFKNKVNEALPLSDLIPEINTTEELKTSEDLPTSAEASEEYFEKIAEKPKRHRRTKAEINAEKMKKEGFTEVKDEKVLGVLKKVESHEYEQTTIFDFVDETETKKEELKVEETEINLPKTEAKTEIVSKVEKIKKQKVNVELNETVKNDDISPNFSVNGNYEKLLEGTIVRNIYNNKEYKVVKTTDKNVVQVFNKESGYHTMARADLKENPPIAE